MSINPTKHRLVMNKESGFTLIEILIAMVILSIGLLGLAGMQATVLKNNQSAYNRSLATQLTYDIADRIRANLDDGNKLDASTYTTIDSGDARAQSDCISISATCTTVDMAENDLYEWNLALSALPSAEGSVTVVASTRTFTVTINWDDNRNGNDNDDPNFQMSFQI
ncbi:MAG: type IV pilus modification protein PilV [Methylosarcina sp.]